MSINKITVENCYQDDRCREAKETILMQAVKKGETELVSKILKNADPQVLEIRNFAGCTALYYAISSNETTEKVVACTRALLEAGADVHEVWYAAGENEAAGENALGYCVNYVTTWEDDEERVAKKNAIIELLIEYGATFVRDGGSPCVDRASRELYGKAYLEGFHIDDGIDPADPSRKKDDLRVLQNAKARVMAKQDEKAKLLLLSATKDRGSTLNGMPDDLQKLILSQIYSNS